MISAIVDERGEHRTLILYPYLNLDQGRVHHEATWATTYKQARSMVRMVSAGGNRQLGRPLWVEASER